MSRNVTFSGSLTEARAARRRLLSDGRVQLPATDRRRRTVGDLAGDWFREGEARWAPATLESRDAAYRKRIAPRFGHVLLKALDREAIEEWARDLLAAGHGRRAVEIAVETLRAILGVAQDRGLIPFNPAARVRLPEPPPPDRTTADRIVDQAGAARLLAACRDIREETIVRAALEAGLRRGEIVGLRWPQVLLDKRRLLIHRQVWQSKKAGKIIRRPKMGHLGRVAISPSFARALTRWREVSMGKGGDPNGYVWPGRDGAGPMSPSSVSHLVGRVGRRAGLVDSEGRHIAHLHGLRHSSGSIALAEGVELPVVAAQLRHSRPDFTARVYSHVLGDERLDRFAAAHETDGDNEGGARARRD